MALTGLLSQSGPVIAVVRGIVEKALGNRASDDNLSVVVGVIAADSRLTSINCGVNTLNAPV